MNKTLRQDQQKNVHSLRENVIYAHNYVIGLKLILKLF